MQLVSCTTSTGTAHMLDEALLPARLKGAHHAHLQVGTGLGGNVHDPDAEYASVATSD